MSYEFLTRPFYDKAPAIRSLGGNSNPTAEHLRACIMELCRMVETAKSVRVDTDAFERWMDLTSVPPREIKQKSPGQIAFEATNTAGVLPWERIAQCVKDEYQRIAQAVLSLSENGREPRGGKEAMELHNKLCEVRRERDTARKEAAMWKAEVEQLRRLWPLPQFDIDCE